MFDISYRLSKLWDIQHFSFLRKGKRFSKVMFLVKSDENDIFEEKKDLFCISRVQFLLGHNDGFRGLKKDTKLYHRAEEKERGGKKCIFLIFSCAVQYTLYSRLHILREKLFASYHSSFFKNFLQRFCIILQQFSSHKLLQSSCFWLLQKGI